MFTYKLYASLRQKYNEKRGEKVATDFVSPFFECYFLSQERQTTFM